MRPALPACLLILLFSCCSAAVTLAANDTVPGALRSYSTMYSIGVEWDIVGDDNHDSTCLVQYRKQGAGTWKEALPLFRVDYLPPSPVNGADQRFNGFAGSVLFLEPGTTYEIRFDLVDPDGGAASRVETISTGSIPVKPINGRTFHVVPGFGGGNGSPANPFQGIDTAQNVAQPGDIFLLHAGLYDGFDGNGEIQLNVAGAPGGYIVWQAAGDGEVVFDPVRIAADYIWLEGVHVQGHANIDDEYGLRTYNAPQYVVIKKNTFTDFYNSIVLNHGGANWFITENTIIGDKDVINVPDGPPSYGGEGIELEHTSGHTVAYNSISRVADGISYPNTNCDIFGNDIFDVTDDGIEPDYGYANIRIWQNRISNSRHAGISFQPMNGGPWYIIRNQVAAGNEAFKLRETTRALIAHNIFVGWKGVQAYGSEGLLNFQSNNNLWVTVQDRYVWESGAGGSSNWRTSLDYDGFDWGNGVYAFKWGANSRYHNLQEFQAATGLEPHGIRVNKDTCFASFNLPSAPPASMPFQYMTLNNGCNAVDGGILLPNINDQFSGSGPDLGPYELGASLPRYGPRSTTPPPDNGPAPSGGKACIAPLLPLLLGN